MSFLPNAVVETPFVGAGRLGTSVILAVSYR
jgi:hypothetical protein